MGQRLRWGIDVLPPRYAEEHFLVTGTTGSGKTVLINMLLKSSLEAGTEARALIYDPKQEVLPIVYNLISSADRVRVLHPFDLRGCAWDLAADIDGPVSARQFATILIPEKASSGSGSESFFTEAVRDLMTGVLLAFINCVPTAKAWTFRDVILTMLYQPYLKYILSLDKTRDEKAFPIASRLRQSYLDGDVRTVSNIRASINAKLSIFEPVAAVWHWAQKKQGQVFSLSQWLKEDCRDLLVLGNDEASRAAIDAINQAIFKRVTELLLARRELTRPEKEAGQNLTWFFLDEVREAGRLDGLSRLLTKGRSKGASVVLGFQDIDGLRATYGNEVANEICGQCGSIAILKLSSPSTAQWACEIFGRRLTEGSGSSRQTTAEGVTRTSSASEEERPFLYSADFLYLPKTSEDNGLTGFFKGSYRDKSEGFKEELPWDAYIAHHLPKAHANAHSKVNRQYGTSWPRPVIQHYLEPWSQHDWDRLGFTGDVICLAETPAGGGPSPSEDLSEEPNEEPAPSPPARTIRNIRPTSREATDEEKENFLKHLRKGRPQQ